MNRRPALISSLMLFLATGLLATPAAADERVPRIKNPELPVAGTCAPIRRTDVTHVMVGERTGLKWFRVAGQAEPMEVDALVALLKSRAGHAQPSTHAVWITASGRHAWIHALWVRQACKAAGIYRVGLRVRSEATGQVMGFPIFLPPMPSGNPRGKGGLLRVRVNTYGEKQAKAESDSDTGHVYAAAQRAVTRRQKFGVDSIVGSLWMATNTPLQYAIRCIDLLYRGGCVGVRLRYGAQVPQLKYKAIPKIEIQGAAVSRQAPVVMPPTIQPRTAPWALEGAARPGWVDLQIVERALDIDVRRPTREKPTVRPNYAALGTGVPPEVRRSVDAQARRWSQQLGSDMALALRGGAGLKKRFVVALRRDEVLPATMAAARRQFPDATRVVPATLKFNVFFFRGSTMLGRASVTLVTPGDQLRVVTAAWRPLDLSASFTLVPFAVDPFAAGEPSAWRIWFEGLFHDLRTRGIGGWPLATEAALRPYCPSAERAVLAQTVRGRGPALAQVAQEVGRLRYDRIALTIPSGTATVYGGNRVLGVLAFGLTSEEQELRLDEFTPRRVR